MLLLFLQIQLCYILQNLHKKMIDENLQKEMGHRGRQLVEQFYSWEKVVEKVEKIYATLVKD